MNQDEPRTRERPIERTSGVERPSGWKPATTGMRAIRRAAVFAMVSKVDDDRSRVLRGVRRGEAATTAGRKQHHVHSYTKARGGRSLGRAP